MLPTLKVDLYGTDVLLEKVRKVIKEGGVGVTISSQSGHRMPALSADGQQRGIYYRDRFSDRWRRNSILFLRSVKTGVIKPLIRISNYSEHPEL